MRVRSGLAGFFVLASLLLPRGGAADESAAATVPWWRGSLEGALAEAGRRDAMVMVDVWAEWCHWCTLFEEEVFPDPLVAAELGRGILPLRLEVDQAKEVNLEFAEAYEIGALPVILFLDAQGEVLHRVDSYKIPADFLLEIAAARDAATPLDRLEARAAQDPSPENLLALGERLRREGRVEQSLELFRRTLEADPRGEAGPGSDALWRLAEARLEQGDREGALDRLERLGEAMRIGPRTGPSFYERLRILESLGRPDAILAVYRRMAARLPEEPGVLSDYAWYLAMRRTDLEEAERAARRAVELAPGEADVFDTLAEVLFTRGEVKGAVSAIEKAIELDPGNVHYREQRLRFVRALRSQARLP